jgi:hypothetical protein
MNTGKNQKDDLKIGTICLEQLVRRSGMSGGGLGQVTWVQLAKPENGNESFRMTTTGKKHGAENNILKQLRYLFVNKNQVGKHQIACKPRRQRHSIKINEFPECH